MDNLMTVAFEAHNPVKIHHRRYEILGEPDAPAPWNWPVWERFRVEFDPLIKAARGNPGVRSTQYLPNRVGTVKFGRIGWKETDHQKWAHGSPTNQDESKSWGFLGVEVWGPVWTACEREGRPPDVFLSVANESSTGGGKGLSFNPVVVIAVASEIAGREASLVSRVLSSLGGLASPNLTGHKRRPWGIPFGASGFTNSIQDLAVSGLFKPGRRPEGDAEFHLLAEEWEPVSVNEIDPGT